MLEAIRERSKGWLAKLILAFITIPFALWGIDSYLHQAGSNVAVAKVDGDTVTMQEYSNALQNMRNKLQSEGKVDPALLDSPLVKQSVLDRLITTRLLATEVKNAKFMIDDEQLGKYITGMPEFQQNGQFSQDIYDKTLVQNRLTPSRFESGIRTDLLLQQARDGIAALAYQPQSVAEQSLKIAHQQREVSIAEIKAADFIQQVKIDPAQIKAYYELHKDKFKVPEQVKVEFVMMSANTLIPKMQASEEETKKYYTENASKFQGSEQRRASHILIGFGVSATPQAKEEAHKKAEQVLAEVKKNPAKFEELAKKYSQDPGSAEKGGDLGVFGRGAMVKPFEDAAFAMKTGEVSDLVQSEFGYHIIKLTEIQGQAQGFDSVKPQIKAELMYQKALSKFSEQAENFSNMVYEQSGSLKPAADAFGLQIQTSDWLSREEGAKFFKNDKLMNLLFSDEALKEKRNTEAVEASSNTLVSARVADYKPSAPRSFDEVKAGIEDYLKLEAAVKLAQQKGEADLADLRQGKEPQKLDWIPPVVVDRKNAQGLTDLTMGQVFKIDASKPPAYAGVADSKKGYLLIKVSRVDNLLANDDTEKKSAEGEFNAALASEYVSAYVKSLRDKGNININAQALGSAASN